VRWTLCACLLALVGCTDQSYRFDFDQDGWEDHQDCAPEDPDIHPEADDPAGDGVDQDCDGADGTAVPAVALYPEQPRTGDDLLLQVVTEAPSWTVAWSLDGEPQPAWTDQASIRSEVTERGQEWMAEVTTQSLLGTDTASAEVEVTIANTPPSASLVVGLDPLVAEGESLAVAVLSDDADGDTVTLDHAWTVDGEPVDGQAEGQLSSAFFDKG